MGICYLTRTLPATSGKEHHKERRDINNADRFYRVGALGGGLSRNLIRAGKSVLVYDISAAMVEKTLAAGTTGNAAQNAADWEKKTAMPFTRSLNKVAAKRHDYQL